MNKGCLFIVFFLLLFQVSTGQNTYKIRHITISNGLSNNTIRTIFQDSKGYMWFGTDDGLNRFDAYRFTVFRNKIEDSKSLPHNYIFALNEDRNGNLYIGTGQGLVTYTEAKGLQFVYFKNGQGIQPIHPNVFSIEVKSNGNIAIGSRGEEGLLIKSEKDSVAKHINLLAGKDLVKEYALQAIAIDSKEQIWAIIDNFGLAKYDEQSGLLKVVNRWTPPGQATRAIADDQNNLWIATTNGLFRYSIKENRLTGQWVKKPGGLSANYISDIAFDKNKYLWIATLGGGVNILNLETGEIQYIQAGESENSLSSQNITSIFIDNEGRKWIGTLRAGMNVLDDKVNRFISVTQQSSGKSGLVNNMVTAIGEVGTSLWIGTDGGGISVWNRRTNRFTNFNQFENNSISSISGDRQENLWIGTFGGGVYRYNERTKTFRHYRCINPSGGQENKIVLRVYEDKRGNIWATTYENGKLYKLNKASDTFEVFDSSTLELFSIYEDDHNNLWAGSFIDLIKIDREHNNHQHFYIGKTVRAIFGDSRGNLWIGTEGGGLMLFDVKAGKITKRYSESDGLSNNTVLNILEDDEGILWLATFNGLSRFDPKTGKFINFSETDGLLSSQFNYRAALKLKDGEIALGNISGLNVFAPGSIRPRTFMPPLDITDIRVNNQTISQSHGLRIKSDKGVITGITIPYDQALLTFDFAALDYTAPDKIRYAYFLDGWDKSWNHTQNRSVTYNNIHEGTYLLRIKSTNASGDWNPAETTLHIIVTPPWYRAWWAMLMYILAFTTILYYFIRYQSYKNKLKYEIKLARINTEKERELSERKASFFTNISHEFRTLLTLIVNPIRDLMQEGDIEEKQEGIKTIYRNSKRMLALVDQLLLFRKAGKGDMPLNISKQNFYHLCKEVYDSFNYQAASKKIDYTLNSTNREIELYADADKIEIAIFNLISNAIKFTPPEGSVRLNISEDAEHIYFAISDSGKGFSPEVSKRIFDQYYQIKSLEGKSKPGFGIGLYLVKNFVEQHSGRVSVTSVPEKDTTFHITLLKGREHFDKNLVINEKEPEREDKFISEISNESDHLTEFIPAGEKQLSRNLTSEKKSLMIVDDNEEMRRYISRIFKNEYVILEADNGVSALDQIQHFLPDIVVTDLVMPEMTGDELCRKIKSNVVSKHIPVILLTANGSPEMKLKCVECGADDFMVKPFEKELLQARINNLLKIRANLEKYFYNEITLNNQRLQISPEDKAFLDSCIAIIEEHLYDEQFTVDTLAAEMGKSHSALYKKIKCISGQSANGFIRLVKLRKAAELFINSASNVNEVAAQIGFNDIKYFRTQFRKVFNITPSAYIKKYREPFQKNFTINPELKKHT